MHPEGFKPFRDSFKSVFTIVWLLLFVALLLDMAGGGSGIAWLVGQKLRFMGHDPAVDSMRMMTVFGTFTSVAAWTCFVQRFLLIVSFVLAGVPIARGLWASVSGK